MNPVPITMSNSAADCMDEQVVSQGAGTGGAIYYYHRNQQYSITAVTTSTGSIAERYAYTAYGQPTILDASASVLSSSAINNRYTYTGREWDATLGLHHFRARWMSPVAGRFLGRDPFEYIDGFSVYRTYFQLDSSDPMGQEVIEVTSTTRDGGCGKNGGRASKKFNFRLPKNHKKKGFLVQEVTVTCQPGSCLVWLILVQGCPEASRRHCLCNLQEPKTFKYYEAWRVGLNKTVPTNPPTMGGTSYDDDANSGLRANETCGISRQDGDLRFFEDSVTGDLTTQHAWAPKPTTYYGSDTGCGTTAGKLYSMDGKNGPPDFWGNNAIATGSRSAEFDWNCCGCKKEKDRSNTVK